MQSRKKIGSALLASFLLLGIASTASAAVRRETAQPDVTVAQRFARVLKRLKGFLPITALDDLNVPKP